MEEKIRQGRTLPKTRNQFAVIATERVGDLTKLKKAGRFQRDVTIKIKPFC